MTEVPEHLLQRSKERRAALGLGGGDDAGAPAAPSEAPATGAQATAVEPAGAAAAPAQQSVAAAPVEAPPPPPLPPVAEQSLRRPKVPVFAIPVLAALPVWAFIYIGALAEPEQDLDPVLSLGQSVYAANCASCHGADGSGGVGRPLDDVIAVFPDRAQHVEWVVEGSPAAGTPYGDPAAGRVSQSEGYGPMPGFDNSLSEEEIEAVVRYEREVIGGEEAPEGAAEGEHGDGEADGDAAEPAGGTESGGDGPAEGTGGH